MTEDKALSRAAPPAPKRLQQTSYIGDHSLASGVGAADNMDSKETMMLSFSVPVWWQQKFKIAATSEHTSMVRVLYDLVHERYGIAVPPLPEKKRK